MTMAFPMFLAAAAVVAASGPVASSPSARALDRGDYAQAIVLAKQRLAAVPADTRARLTMARAEAALGRFDAACQEFRRVLRAEPRNTEALYYLAILGGVLAQREYDRLFALAPDSPRAHQLLGNLHEAEERPAQAE